ncbi:MAG: CDP-2,3-bis-(O-geranylgeranyl)-sn-glycerol synthase [archaeon]|nr:CDP-2,3-bis-(O-geranylgeranyl)-sn-glycerol synthase [archaeon]
MILQEEAIKLLLYLAPMYFTNSSAMLFGGKTALDFGKKFWDAKPILGPGKTFKGVFFGITIGTMVAIVASLLLPQKTVAFGNYVLLGFLLSLGAILGDMVASFFKRRNDIEQGSEVLFLDQLDFVFGGMFLGGFIYAPDFYEIVFVMLLTLVVHKASNYIAYKAKLKKVPW